MDAVDKNPTLLTNIYHQVWYSMNEVLWYSNIIVHIILMNGPCIGFCYLNACLWYRILLQLHHTFVAGLYKCTAFQAVNISAVAACAEFPGLEIRAGSLS